MYIIEINPIDNTTLSIWDNASLTAIPPDTANRHFQQVLDAIIDQGADCFEGDIPQDLLDAAEAKRLSANADD
jgi:hypothetical protein